MRLGTFDPSAVTGFAHGDPVSNGGPPFSGTFKLPSDVPITRSLIMLEAWAIDLIKGNGITDIVIEKPILPRMTSFDAVSQITGRAFMLGVAATKCGANCSLIDIQTWRSQLNLPTQGPKNVLSDPHYAAKFGHRKNGLKDAKRQWVKDRAMELAIKLGSDPKDDNEGDAICIWHAVAAAKRAKLEAPKMDLFDRLKV